MRRPYDIAALATEILTAVGAFLLVFETLWITYGVFTRYVLHNPDRFVTEGSALLLVPLAFLGLPYALKSDAFPKVTLLVDKVPPRIGNAVERFNMVLMILVGAFYAMVTGSAVMRTFVSEASTATLNWPEYVFWIPVAMALGVFTALGGVLLVLGRMPEPDDKGP